MNVFTYIILCLLGLVFGSFLNVLIFRYKPEGKLFGSHIRGRSKCLHCQKNLSWYELIPLLSFFVQKGKCRSCRTKISWQYPLVEISSALIFIFVPLTLQKFFIFWNPFWGVFSFWSVSIVWIIVLMFLLLALFIDLKHYVIPNSANLILFFCAVAWTVIGTFTDILKNFYGGSFLKNYIVMFPSFESIWLSHLVGLFFGALFFFLIVVVSRGRAMGIGDVKLMAALGLLFGWPDIIIITFLSFIVGTLISLPLLMTKRKKISDLIPFGPFIVISAFLIFFFGAGLMDAYFGIIGM